MNLKAVHRIWKDVGLRLGRKVRRKLKVPQAALLELSAPDQAWCLDFACERLENGRMARILAVLDCFTRGCLLLKTASSFPSFEVQRELEWLFLARGRPSWLMMDNGPEFRALRLPAGVEASFIQPGKPWQNGRVESFLGKLRDELLRWETYCTGSDLQADLDDFQDHCNHRRPHRSLQVLAPANYARKLMTTGSGP